MKAKHILTTLCLLALLAAPAAAAGGSGTAADPYRIGTAAELQAINNNLAAYYVLTGNINLAGVTWTPIGTTSIGFHGQLDGAGYTISNLEMSRTDQSAGLFRSLTSGATIKNLKLTDCSVSSTSSWCGVLCGSIIMSSSAHEVATIENVDMVRCSATSSSNNVGVLCGLIYTAAVVDIVDCDLSYCDAESTSSYDVGVLCGVVNSANLAEMVRCTVENSHAKASSNNVGVLCGAVASASTVIMDSCQVENCIAESTSSNNVGVLCGAVASASSCSAKNCVAVNSIAKGTSYVGGFVGLVDKNYNTGVGSTVSATDCTFEDCTIVATSNYAGGVAGRIITDCTGTFNGCTVSHTTILASSYAAGICPAWS